MAKPYKTYALVVNTTFHLKFLNLNHNLEQQIFFTVLKSEFPESVNITQNYVV